MGVLLEAARQNKRFVVYVTESRSAKSGYRTADALVKVGIPVVLILDTAVGYIMEKIDSVLVGAEGVVESGGIMNQVKFWWFSLSVTPHPHFFPHPHLDLNPHLPLDWNIPDGHCGKSGK
jgi:methylthioribose-1-phosphate isomerase